MKDLTHVDFQALLSAIKELNSDFDLQTLEARTLAATSKITAADSVYFSGFLGNGSYANLMWNDDDNHFSPEEMEVFKAYVHENPLFAAFFAEKRFEALKITD